ncbi:MAG: hypothetical protein KAI77_01280, partial [Gammaproteobacteria bacterium]|nr:hypothetical protein [Gammaproteobacteria bacterium]
MGSHHKMHYFFILLGSMALMLSSTAAYAQIPDITGTYSGTVTSDESGCTLNGAPGTGPPNSSFTEQAAMTLTISSLDTVTGAFSGSGTQTFSDGDVDSISFSGIVDDLGNIISGSWNSVEQDGFTASGSFSGSVSNGVLTFSASGQDDFPNIFGTTGEFCFLDDNGSLTLIGGGSVVTPAITPSSTVTEAILFNTEIQTQVSDISRHIASVFGGRRFFWRPRVGD